MGQMWVLKHDDKMALMQDARGMCYLARLLAEPGRTLPAANLLASMAGIDPRLTLGSAGQSADHLQGDRKTPA